MNGNKTLSVVFLVVGIILLALGVSAWHSVSSGVSQTFTGTPSAKTITLLIAGIILAIAGIAGLARKTTA